jgi:hypothetical protein
MLRAAILTARNRGQSGTVSYTVADLDFLATQGPLANGAILEVRRPLALVGQSGFMCNLTFNERGRIDEHHQRREHKVTPADSQRARE